MTAAVEDIRSSRPATDEYVPYFDTYISKVPAGDVVRQLGSQIAESLSLIRALPEEKGGYRYAPGKWTVREVIGHLCDAERVFVYRAMRYARGDKTPLPGFDENLYVANARFDARELRSLADEFEAVRQGTVSFFSSLDGDEWLRRGVANEREMSVRALAWTVAGHERHHVAILRERYQL